MSNSTACKASNNAQQCTLNNLICLQQQLSLHILKVQRHEVYSSLRCPVSLSTDDLGAGPTARTVLDPGAICGPPNVVSEQTWPPAINMEVGLEAAMKP